MAKNHKQSFFERHQWLFVIVGLVGNSMFFAGSVCFLSKTFEKVASWLFIAGSCCMLVSQAAAAKAEHAKQSKE